MKRIAVKRIERFDFCINDGFVCGCRQQRGKQIHQISVQVRIFRFFTL